MVIRLIHLFDVIVVWFRIRWSWSRWTDVSRSHWQTGRMLCCLTFYDCTSDFLMSKSTLYGMWFMTRPDVTHDATQWAGDLGCVVLVSPGYAADIGACTLVQLTKLVSPASMCRCQLLTYGWPKPHVLVPAVTLLQTISDDWWNKE